MTTHFGILAWRIPWTEEPGGLQIMGSQRVGHDERLTLSLSHSIVVWKLTTSIEINARII